MAAEIQTKPTGASVAEFIAGVDNRRRRADAEASLALYEGVTGLPAAMWGPAIVGFGQCRLSYPSGREVIMPAAAFSPRKAHMTYYVGDRFPDADALFARLGKHRKTVACLCINRLDEVDLDVLREIVAREFALYMRAG